MDARPLRRPFPPFRRSDSRVDDVRGSHGFARAFRQPPGDPPSAPCHPRIGVMRGGSSRGVVTPLSTARSRGTRLGRRRRCVLQPTPPRPSNCTISGNSASGVSGGGGVYCAGDSSPTLTNCMVRGTRAVRLYKPQEHSQPNAHVTPASRANTVWPGEGGNINTGPALRSARAMGGLRWRLREPGGIAYQWDPDTGEETAWHRWVFDYHLQPGSPCIDAGTSEGAPTTDIEGHAVRAGRCRHGGVRVRELLAIPGFQPWRRQRRQCHRHRRRHLHAELPLRSVSTSTCRTQGMPTTTAALDISDAITILSLPVCT